MTHNAKSIMKQRNKRSPSTRKGKGAVRSNILVCILLGSLLVFTVIVQLILHSNLANNYHDNNGVSGVDLYLPYQSPNEVEDRNDGFAACLLLKNDNEKLAEWLAYHWLVLPLRYLVVAVDPTGTTSPERILRLWNDTNIHIPGPTPMSMPMPMSVKLMHIIQWGDADFDHFIDRRYQPIDQHRDRQVHFFRSCMRHHKANGRTWVALIDSDEYIAYNHYRQDQGEEEGDLESMSETPEKYKNKAYVQMMQQLRKQLPSFTTGATTSQFSPQYWKKPMSILNFLKSRTYTIEPCLLMPRLFFSAVEMTDVDHIRIPSQWEGTHPLSFVESRYNTSRFRTLRYVHHQEKTAWAHNLYGKVIVDVSRINYDMFLYTSVDSNNMWLGYLTAHNPLGRNSTEFSEPIRPLRSSLLRVNHYLGSFEEYMARGDSRRIQSLYQKKAFVDRGVNYDILPWLQVFIDQVGDNTAHKLLESAGFVDSSRERIIDSKDYIPVFPTAFRWWEDVLSNRSLDHSSHSKQNTSCALLFFGIGRMFLDVTFTSIQKYILDINPDCDIFVHTFNVTTINGEVSTYSYHPSDMLIFSKLYPQRCKIIAFNTEEQFLTEHNLEFYRMLFPRPAYGWNFPSSMDNMIHQWHSIARVWSSMAEFERLHRFGMYQRVGLFRLDLKYVHPVPIDDGDAVVPSMMYFPKIWNGLNDRIFFGIRTYAELWATKRFDEVDGYLQNQEKHPPKSRAGDLLSGLHSEHFLRYLILERFKFPLVQREMCFYRTRSDGTLKSSDCDRPFLQLSMKIPGDRVPGVIVLGMHRSGTSLLAGLLTEALNLNIPGERAIAINHPEQNAKGFYEVIDVIRQNDEWLEIENMSWNDLGAMSLNAVKNTTYFPPRCPGPLGWDGSLAVLQLNYIGNTPWVLKDPRLCLTLPRWLPHIDGKSPPVVFTYRNPIDVAKSLNVRKSHPVSLERGIELWIVYNREAIRNSRHMCRIITSNDMIMMNTTEELYRIQQELNVCGLNVASINLTAASHFVDKRLQHGHTHPVNNDKICAILFRESYFGEMKCKKAVEIYSDLCSGNAFKEGYDWTITFDKRKGVQV